MSRRLSSFKIVKNQSLTPSLISALQDDRHEFINLPATTTEYTLPVNKEDGYSITIKNSLGNTKVIAPKGSTYVGVDDAVVKTFVYEASLGTYSIAEIVDSFFVDRETAFITNDISGGPALVYSVALSADGNTLAVGSPEDDEQGTNMGATYIYRYNTSTSTWEEQVKLFSPNASGTSVKQGFSIALSADGNTLAVGSPEDNEQGTDMGATYIYRYNTSTSTWEEQAKLFSSNASGALVAQGRSIALSADGNTLAVGSRTDSEGGAGFGATYIYRYNTSTSTWEEQVKLFSSSATISNVHQGHSVALSADGNTLAVGSPEDDEQGTDMGATYIYRYNTSTSTWEEQAKLFNSDSTSGTVRQGYSVALSADGNTLAVGSVLDDEGGTDMGATYIYRYNTSISTWEEQTKLFSPNASGTQVQQGSSVALSADGNTLAVGSPEDDEGGTAFGAVYIYKYNSNLGTWVERAKLIGINLSQVAGANLNLGFSVSLSANGNTLASVAPGHDGSNTDIGAVVIYN